MDDIVSQIFVWWGCGHSWLNILPRRYQLSDPVSSLNLPPLNPQHTAAGRESHSMFGATTINMQLIEFTTLVWGAAARAATAFEGAGRVQIPFFLQIQQHIKSRQCGIPKCNWWQSFAAHIVTRNLCKSVGLWQKMKNYYPYLRSSLQIITSFLHKKMNCGEMATRNLLTDGNVQQGWASAHVSKTFLQYYVQVYNRPKVILSKKVFMSQKNDATSSIG